MQHTGPSQFCRAPACSSQVVKYRDTASYLLLLKASEDAHTSPVKEALSRSTQPLSVKHSVSSSSPPESSLAGTPATSAKQLDWLNASVNAAVLGLRMLPPSQRGLAAPRPAESERLDSAPDIARVACSSMLLCLLSGCSILCTLYVVICTRHELWVNSPVGSPELAGTEVAA